MFESARETDDVPTTRSETNLAPLLPMSSGRSDPTKQHKLPFLYVVDNRYLLDLMDKLILTETESSSKLLAALLSSAKSTSISLLISKSPAYIAGA